MGITIHYKGSLNDINICDEFISELTEIAKELNWQYTTENDIEKNIKGILIKPHKKSESLSFLYNSKGTLLNWTSLNDNKFDDEHHHYISIKTQYAPLEIHITVIKLLKYLKKKYISNLNVYDEARYWEIGDTELLIDKMKFLNDMMDKLANELSKLEKDRNETPESIAEKIEKLFKDKLN